jgi:hypothetical protein
MKKLLILSCLILGILGCRKDPTIANGPSLPGCEVPNAIYAGTYYIELDQDNSSWNGSVGSWFTDVDKNVIEETTVTDSVLWVFGYDFIITDCDQRVFNHENATLTFTQDLSAFTLNYYHSSSSEFSGGTSQSVINGTKTTDPITESPNSYHDNFEGVYAFEIREYEWDPWWGGVGMDTTYYDTASLSIFQNMLVLDTVQFEYNGSLENYHDYYKKSYTYGGSESPHRKFSVLMSDSVYFWSQNSGDSWEISGKKL